MLNVSDQLEPVLGQVFSTVHQAYDFYNIYALHKGSGIRMGDLIKSRATKEVIRKKIVCCKEEKKYMADKRQVGKDVKHRRDTRTGCQAKMEISMKNGDWLVDKFCDVHNHDLTRTPSKITKVVNVNQAVDESHYFTMNIAKDGTVRSVFWADGISRSSYLQFGDVVIFDVTYKTNKFKMSFAPFIGVNHHG
ncbi:hypothetical protein POM88_013650 [Heracleum sosnowskyi]|uniref:FAR1 domain-containing protein n=1 Tax=Heracleum sosnowskyi TaxID=360622 RepID=A0AAD8N2Y1_9APIA|nr:hypothetical protein POM88_013650 [Heracleum sosnowskyi]